MIRYVDDAPPVRAERAAFARYLRRTDTPNLTPRERNRAVRAHVRHSVRPIAEHRIADTAMPRTTADGYTRRDGSPSDTLVRLAGCRRWRRVYILQFSNAGSAFVKVAGQRFFLRDSDLI